MLLHTLMSYLNEFLGAAITVIVGFAYKQYKGHVHFKIKKEYVAIAVRLSEQLYSDLKGEEKFNKALEWVTNILAKLKIKSTPEELKGLIEGEVNFVKGDVQKEVTKQESTPVSHAPQPAPVVAPVAEQPKQ